MFTQSAAWYDRFYATKDYAAEARQVTALIHQHNPSARTLLDVACGTGRHLEHLRVAFTCHGVDLDPGLLELARHRLPGLPLTQADMADFDLGHRFDAVTCLFSSIGYMRTSDRLHAAIRTMARHLEPGGVLLVEPWILPEAWIEGVSRVDVIDEDGHKLVRVVTSHRRGALTTVRMHYVVAADGEITTADERHELGLFSRDAYLSAAAAAGLATTWDSEGLIGRGLMIGVARDHDS